MATKGAEEVAKVVVNPIGAAKDVVDAGKKVGGEVVDKVKEGWHALFG